MLGCSSHCRKEMGIFVGVGDASCFFPKNAASLSRDRSSAKSLYRPAMCMAVILNWRRASTKNNPLNICIKTLSWQWRVFSTATAAVLSQYAVTLQLFHWWPQITAAIMNETALLLVLINSDAPFQCAANVFHQAKSARNSALRRTTLSNEMARRKKDLPGRITLVACCRTPIKDSKSLRVHAFRSSHYANVCDNLCIFSFGNRS